MNVASVGEVFLAAMVAFHAVALLAPVGAARPERTRDQRLPLAVAITRLHFHHPFPLANLAPAEWSRSRNDVSSVHG